MIDIARDWEVVHQNIVKGFMMRVEDHHEQICALHKRRSKGGAGLLDGDVIVLAVVAWQCGCCRAFSLDRLVRVGVDVVDIIEACPFAVFLEFQGGGPGEWKRVAGHVAVGNSTNHAISDLLTADWVCHLTRNGSSHKDKKNNSLHSYLNNNMIINQATVNLTYISIQVPSQGHFITPLFALFSLCSFFTIQPPFYPILSYYNINTDLTWMLGLRKTPSFINEQVQKSENKLVQWARLIIPPFVIYTCICIIHSIRGFFDRLKAMISSDQIEDGEISKEFNRRRYQEHLQNLKITQQELGWTNQVLYQQTKKAVNYYLPVFITNKIKSIQDISVQSLTGNISCALIVNVCYEGLPEEIIKKLESAIIIQLNRGEAIKLEDDGITITVKRQKKSSFLIFTIRKLFLAFLLEDTLWSPFQLVELIISITLNTVTVHPHSLQKIDENSTYNPNKEYKISFNCMRNSDTIPISYALDCVFGVYDLAEKKLESYHSRFGTYSQIQKNFEEYEHKEKNRRKEEREKAREGKGEKSLNKSEEKAAKQEKAKEQDIKKAKSEKVIREKEQSILELVAQTTMKRLSIRPSTTTIKKPAPKVKYFQYTHFVIPLYKYPGNSLATIFIPIFLLALVSLAIFFQQPQLSGRIGAIATMILGYIALIPSIKEQLPPSSKLTVIESVVYIETMCCLLCLYESFTIDGEDEYKFIWYENIAFMLCLVTHISTFFFIIGLYTLHKLKWEPDYNSDEKVIEIKPGDNRLAWDNPFCDEVFHKFNKSIATGRYTDKEREEMRIKPLNEKKEKVEKKPSDKPINIFESLLSKPKDREKKEETEVKKQEREVKREEKEVKNQEVKSEKANILADLLRTPKPIQQDFNPDEFSVPDPQLYFKTGPKMKQI